jgi:hypothetical protein
MTDDKIALRQMLEKGSDATFYQRPLSLTCDRTARSPVCLCSGAQPPHQPCAHVLARSRHTNPARMFWRAAATPTLRADRSARRAAGIRRRPRPPAAWLRRAIRTPGRAVRWAAPAALRPDPRQPRAILRGSARAGVLAVGSGEAYLVRARLPGSSGNRHPRGQYATPGNWRWPDRGPAIWCPPAYSRPWEDADANGQGGFALQPLQLSARTVALHRPMPRAAAC